MGAISVRLPDSLHQLVREMSVQDRVSLNQFIASAVAEKASAFNTEKYIGERAGRASKQGLKPPWRGCLTCRPLQRKCAASCA